jgi:hypothetical protein
MPQAATMAAPALPQYMRALERANAVRLARADLKRRIASGRLAVADVILAPPEEARSMTIADLLMSQRRWGYTRCRKFLQELQITETRTIEKMTERQRRAVAQLLGHRPEPACISAEMFGGAMLTPVAI